MSKLLDQFHEDRALRDAAKSVLLADIEHARTSFSPKGFADRVGGRVTDGAKDVYSVAKVHADDNRGIIATLIGAILLWISRDTILEILGLDQTDMQAEVQPGSGVEGNDAGLRPDETETENTFQAEADPPAPLDGLPDGDNDEQ